METVKISVIVPVYNVEKYLKDCVDSLKAQTFSSYEVLLIDDGSKDTSGTLCDTYQRGYDNIKVYHKPNGGLSDARNYGVEKAQGLYVTFVDSDDYVHPDFLKDLYEALLQGKKDMSMCFYRATEENYNYADNSFEEVTGTLATYDRKEILSLLCKANVSTPYEVGVCKLIKKEIMQKVKFPVGRLHEDTATTYRIYGKADGVAVVDRCLYYYRQREGSITSRFTEKRLDLIPILEKRQRYYASLQDDTLAKGHYVFMINCLCRLRCEAMRDKKSHRKIQRKILQLRKQEIFRRLTWKKKGILLIKCYAVCLVDLGIHIKMNHRKK